MEHNFSTLFEDSLKSIEMTPGRIITGVVIDIDNNWITVHSGLKSEGIISRSEFLDENGELAVEVGDEVNIILEQIEDGFGLTKLSREKARTQETWLELGKAYQESDIINGVIQERIKGGFAVTVKGVRCFLPGSLIDIKNSADDQELSGMNFEFKVIKLDKERNNVVLSRRAVMESVTNEERDALIASLHEGAVVKGYVKNLTDYGAFIDLGGVDGLLHITDIAWQRIKHPSDVLSAGEEVKVSVLKFDRSTNRVSLGMKQLTEDPWALALQDYPQGTVTKAHVRNITDFGCFAEIKLGIEGLVHISEMDWANKNINPHKVVELGQEIEVIVLESDIERRRLSLSIKQCLENPWVEFSKEHKKGDILVVEVKSRTDFGLFVGLENNIDGMIHVSDIPSIGSDSDTLCQYEHGDKIEAVILNIDVERDRISLGISQLEKDKVGDYLVANSKGAIVTGVVKSVEVASAIIELSDGVEAVLQAGDISREKIDDARSVLNVGDAISAKITTIDKKKNTINLSIKAKDADLEKEAIIEHRKQVAEESKGITLGDLIKAQIKQNNS